MPNSDIYAQLVPINVSPPVIAPLAPSQDTTPDQLQIFHRRVSLPFVRHSPLPVQANAASNAATNSSTKTIVESAISLIPATPLIYDVVWSLPGSPPTSTTYLVCPFHLPIAFSANFGGAAGRCLINPTSTATFTFKKLTAGGVTSTIGTFAIATSGAFTFTSSLGAGQSFSIGDSLLVTTISVGDVTLSDVAIALSGAR